MKLSKKIKFNLFMLLIVLNIILRQTSPHEIGRDSFDIHILANSVSTFGRAEWWLRPESIFGLYPNSYSSSVPFLSSGISQSIEVDMERVIWLFCVIIGLFSIFAAYILAGKIIDDDLFKFLVAFSFSISPGILYYSTWTLTSRGTFIILLPMFVCLLLKSRTAIVRYSLLTFILSILLFATHHLAYFLILIFVSYFIIVIFYNLKRYINFVKIPEKFVTFALVTAFIVMFTIPFHTGRFIGGSRYAEVIEIFFGYLPRYIGVLLIIAVGGFTYLLFKPNKRFGDWFLLLTLLLLTPFLYIQTYMKWFILTFVVLLVGIGLINVIKLHEQNKKNIRIIIVILLLLHVSFSGFYQFLHTYKEPLFGRYMQETTYTAGIWVKDNINGSTVSNEEVTGIRIFAVSGIPLFTGHDVVDQVYGFTNVSHSKFRKRPITSEEYWFDGPYEKIAGSTAEDNWHFLMKNSYNKLVPKLNLTHVIENKKTYGARVSRHKNIKSEFLQYIYGKKDNIFDNGVIAVWNLN